MKKDRYCVIVPECNYAIWDLTEDRKDLVCQVLRGIGIDFYVYIGAVHLSNHSKVVKI